MNHNKCFTQVISLALVVLIVAGCGASGADLIGSTAPLACPTTQAQSCPTAATQAVPERSSFQSTVASMANAIIAFEAGDKCSIQIRNTVQKTSGLKFEMVVNDNTYQDYIVWFYYVDPGKTLEDLKTQDTGPITPAPFIHILGALLASPMSRTFYASPPLTINADQGPIFFTCQVDGPGPRKQIDHLGPLEYTAP